MDDQARDEFGRVRKPGGAVTAAGDGPFGARGRDSSRLSMALATARLSEAAREARVGIPGLAEELFPAAAWRRELAAIVVADRERNEKRTSREDALVTEALAHLRAEDILREAREQARRLVGAAAAVAGARRRQADRAAAETLARAERAAARRLAQAEDEAQAATGSGQDVARLNERLLKLRSALVEAEAKLGAFTAHTRRTVDQDRQTIDLDAEHERGEIEAALEGLTGDVDRDGVRVGATTSGSAAGDDDDGVEAGPHPRPKGRFTVPGFTPDRIETLRDEITP